MSQQDLNLLGIIKILLKWRKPLIYICLMAIAISVAVSFILPSEFKSTCSFYIGNSKSFDIRNLFETKNGAQLEVFGDQEDVDRAISLANSSQLALFINEKFHLYSYYKIDSTDPAASLTFIDKFKGDMNVVKNDQGALEISFISVDKALAANIANAIVEKVDEMNRALIIANNQKTVDLYKEALDSKERELKALTDSLNHLRKRFKIYDPKKQGEILSSEVNLTLNELNDLRAKLQVYKKHYSENDTIIVNTTARIRGLEQRYKTTLSNGGKLFSEGSPLISSMEFALEDQTKAYVEASELYRKGQITLNSTISSVFIIEKAAPAARKSKPVRWMIVLSGFLITFFISSGVAIIYEVQGDHIRKLFE